MMEENKGKIREKIIDFFFLEKKNRRA